MKRGLNIKHHHRLLIISILVTFIVFGIYLLNYPFTITGHAVINNSIFSNSTDFSTGTFTGTFVLRDNIRLNKTLTPIGEYNNSLGRAFYVYVSDDFAYVTASDTSTFTILNVTNKSNPTFMSNYTNTTNMDTPYSIFVKDDYAYVTSSSNNSLFIFNITNKSDPIVVGYYEDSSPPYSIGGAFEVYVRDDYAYVTANPLGDDFLTIINVTNKSNPQGVGDYNFSIGWNPSGVFVENDYAYVTSQSTNFSILNVTNKSNILLVGYYDVGVAPYSVQDARYTKIQGDYAYVTSWCCSGDGNMLTILNISDKTKIL